MYFNSFSICNSNRSKVVAQCSKYICASELTAIASFVAYDLCLAFGSINITIDTSLAAVVLHGIYIYLYGFERRHNTYSSVCFVRYKHLLVMGFWFGFLLFVFKFLHF